MPNRKMLLANVSSAYCMPFPDYENELVSRVGIALFVKEQVSYVLLSVGLLGNGLCMLVFHTRTRFASPHFMWYKAIAWADTVYCVNMAAEMIVEAYWPPGAHERHVYFISEMVAKYVAHVCGFVSSGTTYWVMYLTLLAAAERFSATCAPLFYSRHVKHLNRRTAISTLVCSFILAFAANSWAFMTNLNVHEVSYENGTTVYELSKSTNYAKDVYNLTVSLAHCLVLVVLSVGCLCMRPRNHRHVATQRSRSHERALNWLMGVVVALQLLRSALREARRIKHLQYAYSHGQVANPRPDCDDSVDDLYARFIDYWLLLGSTCITLVDHACKCFVYLIGRSFRHEMQMLLRSAARCCGKDRCYTSGNIAAQSATTKTSMLIRRDMHG